MKFIYICPENDGHRWALAETDNPKLCPKCKAETGKDVILKKTEDMIIE